MAELETCLTNQGFAIIESLLPPGELAAWIEAIDAMDEMEPGRGGVRGLFSRCPSVRDLAESGAPGRLARRLLGERARAVKATLFDKTPTANWQVPIHQDQTIAVDRWADLEGFGPWSVKDGEVHVQPPVEILERIVAVRIHLDAAGESNGALRVVPGSHRQGKLSPRDMAELRDQRGEVICSVPPGGAMLMFPLLVHASSKSARPERRRVVHLEYSALDLPGGLQRA